MMRRINRPACWPACANRSGYSGLPQPSTPRRAIAKRRRINPLSRRLVAPKSDEGGSLGVGGSSQRGRARSPSGPPIQTLNSFKAFTGL